MSNEFTHLFSQLTVMQGFPKPWFVCGGWALDLHLGKQTREHHDIDLGVFREDQLLLQKHFAAGYALSWINDGIKHSWENNSFLQLPIHELRLEKNGAEVEFVLNERNATDWVYRRNISITLPLSKSILYTSELVPFLAPEIVLLYKSTVLSAKNQGDFDTCLPALDVKQRDWLRNSIQLAEANHPWVESLQNQ